MSLVAFAGGFFGGQNKIFAEERAAQQAAKATTAENLKKYQEERKKQLEALLNSEKGLEQIRTPGWWDINKDEVFSIGGSQLRDTFALMINSVAEEDSLFSYGNLNVPFAAKDVDSGTFEEASHWLTSMNSLLHTQDGKDAFAAIMENPDSAEAKQFMSDAKRFGQTYILGKRKKFSPSAATEFGGIPIANLGKNFDGFSSNTQIANIMKNLWGDSHIEAMRQHTEGGGLPDNVFSLHGGELTRDGEHYSLGLRLDLRDPKHAGKLSTLKEVSASLNITPQQFLDKFTGIERSFLTEENYKPELAYRSLLVGLDSNFANLRPENLDPQEGSSNIQDSDLWNMGKHLVTNLASHSHMAAALQPYMRTSHMMDAASLTDTITTVDSNEYIKLETGKTIEELSEGFTSSNDALKKLHHLHHLQANAPSPAAAGVLQQVYGFAAGDGFVAGLVSSLGFSKGSTEAERKEYDAVITRLQDQYNKSASQDENLGRMAALRIALAFTLARAADPSGRLSNQDIDIQLARLGAGAGFNTVKNSLARIEEVIKDTRNLRDYYSVFTKISRTKSLNKQQMIEIDANIAAYKAAKFYREHELYEVGDGIMEARLALPQSLMGGAFDNKQTIFSSKVGSGSDTGVNNNLNITKQLENDKPNITVQSSRGGGQNLTSTTPIIMFQKDQQGDTQLIYRYIDNNTSEAADKILPLDQIGKTIIRGKDGTWTIPKTLIK